MSLLLGDTHVQYTHIEKRPRLNKKLRMYVKHKNAEKKPGAIFFWTTTRYKRNAEHSVWRVNLRYSRGNQRKNINQLRRESTHAMI